MCFNHFIFTYFLSVLIISTVSCT